MSGEFVAGAAVGAGLVAGAWIVATIRAHRRPRQEGLVLERGGRDLDGRKRG